MRIDDLNRASQSHEASKTESIRPDHVKGGSSSSSAEGGSDAASISDLANALTPDDARLQALRLQVERGEYRVSAQDIASGIIEDHTVG